MTASGVIRASALLDDDNWDLPAQRRAAAAATAAAAAAATTVKEDEDEDNWVDQVAKGQSSVNRIRFKFFLKFEKEPIWKSRLFEHIRLGFFLKSTPCRIGPFVRRLLLFRRVGFFLMATKEPNSQVAFFGCVGLEFG